MTNEKENLGLDGTVGSDVSRYYGADVVVDQVIRVHFSFGPEMQDGGTAEGGYAIVSVHHVTCLQKLLIVPMLLHKNDQNYPDVQSSMCRPTPL